MHLKRHSRTIRLDRLIRPARGEQGVTVVVVMVFIMVFLIVAAALFWLVSSQMRATETERSDVKAFNVTEAGIDAGMLALKTDWPEYDYQTAYIDNDSLKTLIKEDTSGLWDPSRSDPTEFIQVSMYDNVDESGATTTIAYPPAPAWDSNGDGLMFVDSTANVDDNRHRILILAQRQSWNLTFPYQALYANRAGGNGSVGFRVRIEYAPEGSEVGVDVSGDIIKKGLFLDNLNDPRWDASYPNSPTSFDSIVSNGLMASLKNIAINQGTYFTSATAAQTFLYSGNAGGSVVYVESDSPVVIAGNSQVGSTENPVALVIDTPPGTDNGWDQRGTSDFFGVIVVRGNLEVRGTSGVWGGVVVSGDVESKGLGVTWEINYDERVFNALNGQYTISVNIVPNTWEEYTLPRSETVETSGS